MKTLPGDDYWDFQSVDDHIIELFGEGSRVFIFNRIEVDGLFYVRVPNAGYIRYFMESIIDTPGHLQGKWRFDPGSIFCDECWLKYGKEKGHDEWCTK